MKKKEKLKILQKLSEEILTKSVIIPLLESASMNCMNVNYTHRKLEFGKDIIYYKDDEFGNRLYTGIQVKKNRIATRNIDNIFRQTCEGFNEPFRDLSDGKKKNIDRFVLLTSNVFIEEAKDSLWASLQGAKLDRLVTCIDGNQLVKLIDKNLPSSFWNDFDYFNKYFLAIINDVKEIKDISAIGQKEPISLQGIYVSRKLSLKSEDHLHPIIADRQIFNAQNSHETYNDRINYTQYTNAEWVIDQYKNIIILGDPGSGKTTLLRNLALNYCRRNIETGEKNSIPLLINLRSFVKSGMILEEYIFEVFRYYNLPDAKALIINELRNGNCLLLLDGFDELAMKENQDRAIIRINEFLKSYNTNHIIITSRTASYNNDMQKFQILELVDYNDTQIETFIEKWFGKTEFIKTKSVLESIMTNESIHLLARNPLMLTIIAIIYEEDCKLPRNRVALYDRCIEVLLRKWDVQKKIKNKYKMETKKFILRKIAYYGHNNNFKIISKEIIEGIIRNYLSLTHLRENDITSLLDEIIYRSHIIRKKFLNSYDFLHLSFQEYLTAMELREREDGISIIIQHLSEPWWEEPIILYAGICNDATTLIRKINKNVPEDIFFNNLFLFGKCIAITEFTNTSLKEDIICDLWKLYNETTYKKIRSRALKILYLNQPKIVKTMLLKLLNNKNCSIRIYAARALGEIGSEEAIEPLLNVITTDKVDNVRYYATHALCNIKSERVIEPLLEAIKVPGDRYIHYLATNGLKNLGNEKTIETLLKILKESKEYDVRYNVISVLVFLGKEKMIEPLKRLIKEDKDPHIREKAVKELGSIESDEVVKPLIDLLKHEKEYFVLQETVDVLGNFGSDEVVEHLVEFLKHEKDNYVREKVITALGNIGDERTIGPVFDIIKELILDNDIEDYIEELDFTDLTRIINKNTIKPLMDTLDETNDLFKKIIIIYFIGIIEIEFAVEKLIEIIKSSEDKKYKIYASYALGELGSEKAIYPLVNLFYSSDDDEFCSQIIEILGGIKSDNIIMPLEKVLMNKKYVQFRRDVVYAFKKLGSEKAILPLLKILNDDEYHDVHGDVVTSLGNCRSSRVIGPLVKVLNENDNIEVRGNAVSALNTLMNEYVSDVIINYHEEERNNHKEARKIMKYIESKNVIESLIEIFTNHDNYIIKGQSIEILSKIENDEVYNSFFKVIRNERNPSLVKMIIKALGKIGNEEAIEPLLEVFRDESGFYNNEVKEEAFETLEIIHCQRQLTFPQFRQLKNTHSK